MCGVSAAAEGGGRVDGGGPLASGDDRLAQSVTDAVTDTLLNDENPRRIWKVWKR